jgi:hypothetical protein
MKTPLINRAQVRQMALDVAKHTRGRPFTRISSQFLEECNVQLAAYVRSRVRCAPSRGVTL